MAKLTLLIIFVLVLAIVSDSTVGQRSKTRSKVSVRKQKVATTAAPTTPVPAETTTIPEEEIPETTPEDEPTTLAPLDQTEPNVEIPEEDQSVKKLSPKLSKFLSRNPKIETNLVNSAYGCDDECDQEDCVTPDLTSCPTGLVLDRCNCCLVCGAGEGNRCNDAVLNLPYNPDIGICGPGLTCKLRSDLELFDTPEALCECRDKRIVCGSDNRTYSSECKLREAASAKPELLVAMWSPCVSAPWITTQVENATISVGDEVALSCEVRGYPAPVVHWEFIADGPRSKPVVLPGDDSSIVVVNRGGPEQMMTTSWIQIIGVTPRRQGKYICSAQNPQGTTRSEAFVSVYKSSG